MSFTHFGLSFSEGSNPPLWGTPITPPLIFYMRPPSLLLPLHCLLFTFEGVTISFWFFHEFQGTSIGFVVICSQVDTCKSKPNHSWICICIRDWKVASLQDADAVPGKTVTHPTSSTLTFGFPLKWSVVFCKYHSFLLCTVSNSQPKRDHL